MRKYCTHNPEYTASIEQDNVGNWWVLLFDETGTEIDNTALVTDDKKTALKVWMKY